MILFSAVDGNGFKSCYWTGTTPPYVDRSDYINITVCLYVYLFFSPPNGRCCGDTALKTYSACR
jgi:hypothetical protein